MMNEITKHTPGPWRVASNHEGQPIVISESHGAVPIRTPFRTDAFGVGEGRSDHDPEMVNANARLIAAAPELLGALEGCLVDLEHYVSMHGPGPDRRLANARAAIAKARGEA